MARQTEEKPIKVLNAEEAAAFEQFAQPHIIKSIRWLIFKMGVKDYATIEDIIQDTLYKAMTAFGRGEYTETSQFKGWLARIAVNGS